MSGKARNCSTWSSGRHTPRSSYCAQLPVAEATISPSPVRSHAQPRASKYCSRTSIGAPSSRSSWISSSLRITPPAWPSGAAALGAFRSGPADLRFERGDARLQDLILVARGGGHRLDRLELVAADEILPAHPFAHLLARRRTRLRGPCRRRSRQSRSPSSRSRRTSCSRTASAVPPFRRGNRELRRIPPPWGRDLSPTA